MEQDLSKRLTDFDADFSPNNPINIKAARQRGWRYDKPKGYYTDKDGFLMADKYGQDLG